MKKLILSIIFLGSVITLTESSVLSHKFLTTFEQTIKPLVVQNKDALQEESRSSLLEWSMVSKVLSNQPSLKKLNDVERNFVLGYIQTLLEA